MFEKLLSKQDQRQIALLKYIENHIINRYGQLELSVLAKQLNCSFKTLDKDLLDFQENDLIKGYESGDSCIDFHQVRSTFRHYQHRIYFESFAAKLIECSYYRPEANYQEICQELDCSMSTLRKFTPQLNEYLLRYFRVKLDSYRCHLVGPETKIRQLYYHYFFEKASYQREPIDDPSCFSCQSIDAWKEQEMNSLPSFVSYALSPLFIQINCHRYKQGFLLESPSDRSQEWLPIIQSFKQYFQIDSEDPIQEVNLFYPYSSIPFVKSIPSNDKRQKKIELAIEQLFSQFDLKPVADFSVTLQFLILLHAELGPSIYLFINKKEPFLLKLEEKFPQFMDELFNLIESYQNILLGENPIFCQSILSIVYDTIHNWPDLYPQLSTKMNSYKILIIPYYSKQLAENIKATLSRELPFIDSFEIYEGYDIREDYALLKNYDLIISQIPHLDLPHQKVIYFDNVLYMENFQAIINYLRPTFHHFV